MTLCILTFTLFSQTLIVGFSNALNVTVTPYPWAWHPVGENASLWCSVSQKRRPDSLLTVRWVFSTEPGHEQVIGRITKSGAAHIAANWSHRGDLSSDNLDRGHRYRLTLHDLHLTDQGNYICRVQEVARHRSRWTAVSNGTAATQLRVSTFIISEEKKLFSWKLFQDLYLYAVLLCCVGILSLLIFLLILLCQTIFQKRRSRVRWKCSQQSWVCDYIFPVHHSPCDESPSAADLLSNQSGKRKRKRNQQAETPPAIPVKGPLITIKKNPQRPILLPRLVEEGLAYAELELMKSPLPVKDPNTSTVYAQILFEESSLQKETHNAGKNMNAESSNHSTTQYAALVGVPRIESSNHIRRTNDLYKL
ncbi:V-set and transmembrane domain-containing protein 4 isoform X2 [Pelobates fuscus]|uniref:V-set and transmembrane domain-containing protein 4 isoform X2 n=1 Tax=Pelobates fuscus TaxID=191477 RepID=UPI002FE4ECD7